MVWATLELLVSTASVDPPFITVMWDATMAITKAGSCDVTQSLLHIKEQPDMPLTSAWHCPERRRRWAIVWAGAARWYCAVKVYGAHGRVVTAL